MITDTRERILTTIRNSGQARVVNLARELKMSSVAVHKHLNRLLADRLIEKRGTPPVVYYVLKSETPGTKDLALNVSSDVTKAIEENFLTITPDGHVLQGVEGFLYWYRVYGKNKAIDSLAQDYSLAIHTQHARRESGGWFDATEKLTSTFPESPIRKLLFSDVYSIPVFGRTKLAKLVMHAKTSQDKALISSISLISKHVIEAVIKTYNIEAVGFIPPTVPRPLQFMSELERDLMLNLPVIEFSKVIPGSIAVPQKSLSSTADRVVNARESIFPNYTSRYPYKRILLIDDVAGSGASFNETAMKLVPLAHPGTEIYAFALVGNIKGYEVIKQI